MLKIIRIGQSAGKVSYSKKGVNILYKHFKYEYSCDADGNIYSHRTNKYLKLVEHNSGYKVIGIYYKGKSKQYRAHRFIMECYIGMSIKENMVINHIDGNKGNNSICNLEEVTYSENTQHAVRLGLTRPSMGEANGMAILTEETVRDIIRDIIKGIDNHTLGSKYRVEDKHISLIRNRKRWQHIFLEDEFKSYKIIKSLKETTISNEVKSRVKYLLENTNLSLAKIAEEVQIHPSLVSRFKKGLIWKNI